MEALRLLHELRDKDDSLPPMIEAAFTGYRDGKRASSGIPAMVEGLINLVRQAVEISGDDDAVVTAYNAFVGHETSDKTAAGSGPQGESRHPLHVVEHPDSPGDWTLQTQSWPGKNIGRYGTREDARRAASLSGEEVSHE